MPDKLLKTNDWLKPFLEYKRIIIYNFILLLVAAGHYYLMQIPLDLFRTGRWSIISMLCILCLGGSFILMARKNGGRARNLFSFVMFMVGLTNLFSLISGLTTGYAGVVEYKFLSLPMLVYGSVYAYFFLLYPIEAFRPGWLTLRRAIIMFLPTIVVPIILLLVTKMQSEPAPLITSRTTLIDEFWNFNALIPLLILTYPIFGLVVMIRYRKNYMKCCENNFASMENIDIKWLDDYIFSNFVITFSCLVVVFSDNVRSVLMHNIIFLLFFMYAFYRVLFQKNAYPEGYFKESMDEAEAETREEMHLNNLYQVKDIQPDIIPILENGLNAKSLFESKLPDYKNKLEQWMQTEKPYLRKDFKLTDAMEILPLNRSYLSRLFNDGYGESFYQFVMRYRITESKRLLLSRPDLNITDIADLSGFSSLSVFGRAFTQEMNCSPTQWREKEKVI
jgi:AraC-like DNA-binding protein